jgi:phosphoglycerate dehydrogenase-like enzyme
MRALLPLFLCLAAAAGAQTKKIIANPVPDDLARELESTLGNVKLVKASGPQLEKELADADAIIGGIGEAQFSKAKKLKWVQTTSAGVEGQVFPALVNSDVVLTNAKNVYGPQIADHAFAFLLALTRKLNQTIPNQRNEDWPRDRGGMIELNGKTAVVIGVGSIGGNIAQRAHGFGMRVIGVDPRDLPPSNVVSKLVPPDQLDSVLPEADVVFVAAPLTRKSEGMIGPRQFELMKDGAYFIAMSRGKVYNTEALVKALDSKKLAGAGLDVTNPEPLPKGHPLWKFPNVIITAHTSGGSDNLSKRTNALLRENIARFAKGMPLLNVVNKAEGY